MRRLLHSLGRWRGTHCDRCGRPVTDTQAAFAVNGGHRLIHFHTHHCAGSENPR